MPEVRLFVGGRIYEGWTQIQVERSIESLAGTFSMTVHDRWGSLDEPWPIREEDECEVKIDDTTLLKGFVDRRSLSLSAQNRAINVSGRDLAAVLVDASVPAGPWTLRNQPVSMIARHLAKPYGITVNVAPGLSLPTQEKIVIRPGETPNGVLQPILQRVGVLAVSDGAGGILLTRSGTARAEAVVEGQNLFAADVEYDASERFRKYVVLAQTRSKDDKGQKVRAEAVDLGVRRANRTLIIRPERGQKTSEARAQADWEARIRAARSETVSVTMQGWQQSSGEVWPVNALVDVRIPALGVAGQLLIVSAAYSLDTGGSFTRIRLMRPDAFASSTAATVETPSWKE